MQAHLKSSPQRSYAKFEVSITEAPAACRIVVPTATATQSATTVNFAIDHYNPGPPTSGPNPDSESVSPPQEKNSVVAGTKLPTLELTQKFSNIDTLYAMARADPKYTSHVGGAGDLYTYWCMNLEDNFVDTGLAPMDALAIWAPAVLLSLAPAADAIDSATTESESQCGSSVTHSSQPTSFSFEDGKNGSDTDVTSLRFEDLVTTEKVKDHAVKGKPTKGSIGLESYVNKEADSDLYRPAIMNGAFGVIGDKRARVSSESSTGKDAIHEWRMDVAIESCFMKEGSYSASLGGEVYVSKSIGTRSGCNVGVIGQPIGRAA
jgi:hypothetical protein